MCGICGKVNFDPQEGVPARLDVVAQPGQPAAVVEEEVELHVLRVPGRGVARYIEVAAGQQVVAEDRTMPRAGR